MWAGEHPQNLGPQGKSLDYTAMSYWQFNSHIPSLACQGKALVRTTFKLNSVSADASPTCADCRLVALGLPSATPVVRCELQLGPETGGGGEVQRALLGKEANCRRCSSCKGGGGCPHKAGQWYSDR